MSKDHNFVENLHETMLNRLVYYLLAKVQKHVSSRILPRIQFNEFFGDIFTQKYAFFKIKCDRLKKKNLDHDVKTT